MDNIKCKMENFPFSIVEFSIIFAPHCQKVE